MKLAIRNEGFEYSLPENRVPFKIKTNAKMFDILSSGIYSDKIRAVIRELSCNAYDAHIEAGKREVKFTVNLPTRLDPIFSVEDEGTGIDPEKIGDIFWTYGESSKNESNDQIGALGLGSKSPFAYTRSSFVVKNRYNGTEYTYVCFINENGIPDGSMLNQEITEKPSGVTVEFAVRSEDIQQFHLKAGEVFKYWDTRYIPIFNCQLTIPKPDKKIEGQGWYMQGIGADPIVAVQGNIAYPVDDYILPEEFKLFTNFNLVLNFEIGELEFSSSRESLQYTKGTVTNLISKLQFVKRELIDSINQIRYTSETQLEFAVRFNKTFNKIRQSGQINSVIFSKNLYKFLEIADEVEFDGVKYNTSDLCNGFVKSKSAGYQPIGLYDYLNKTNQLSNTTLIVLEHSSIAEDWKYKRKLNNFTENCLVEHIIYFTDGLTFYVNDVGVSGRRRYKALYDKLKSDIGSANINRNKFVDIDSNTITVEGAIELLKVTLQRCGLDGANVIKLSNSPDYRVKTVRGKREVEYVKKLKVISYLKQIGTNPENEYNFNCGSVDFKCNKLYKRYEFKQVKLSELKSEIIVPYVLFSKSLRYRDAENDTTSIVNNNNLTSVSIQILCKELFESGDGVNKFVIYVFNEREVASMKSKGVNLVSLKALLQERIEKLDKEEGFVKEAESIYPIFTDRIFSILHDSGHQNIFDSLSDSSAFKSMFKSHSKFRDDENIKLKLVKTWIYKSIKCKNEAIINNGSGITDTYPMLELIDIHGLRNLNAKEVNILLNYIKSIDIS